MTAGPTLPVTGSRLFGFAALAAMLAVPFVAFVQIGRQPYRPNALAERIRLLADVPGIEQSWTIPPLVALASVVVAVPAALAVGRWHRRLLIAATTVALVAAGLSYRMVAQSDLASADVGVHLLAVACVLLVLATAASWFEQRSSQTLG